MHKVLFTVSAGLLLAAWLSARALNVSDVAPAGAQEATSGARTLLAAKAFLGSLFAEQRGKVSFEFEDKERVNWHFIPRTRQGLSLIEMSRKQRDRVTDLIKAGLNEIGVKTVEQVRSLEAILRELEGPERTFARDPDLYYLSVFGKPAREGHWGWRFEGHHICLNFTLDGDKILSATPFFLGANPAIVREGPRKGLRVLAGVEDIARELMTSLDEGQLRQALGEGKVEEVKSTQSARYTDALPAGLAWESMNETQRGLLKKLVGDYTKHFREDIRQAVHREIRRGGKLHIAWRGSLKPFEAHSYIVHGESFVISYSNRQNNAAHVHAALRVTKGEFGLEK